MIGQISLFDLLKHEVERMVQGIGRQDRGNIYPLIMDEVERSILNIVLESTNYNYLASAKILGIGRTTLYRRIDRLGIPVKKEIKRVKSR